MTVNDNVFNQNFGVYEQFTREIKYSYSGNFRSCSFSLCVQHQQQLFELIKKLLPIRVQSVNKKGIFFIASFISKASKKKAKREFDEYHVNYSNYKATMAINQSSSVVPQ